jgi:lipopolysaccharide transport system permease protein
MLAIVLGISLPLSVLNAKYRDVEFIWGIIIHAGFFVTPIFYRFDMLPEYLQNIFQFLPTVQILTIAHDLTLYGTIPSITTISYSIFMTLIIMGVGYGIFRKLQARIVEEL